MKRSLLLCFAFLSSIILQAQLNVTGGYTATQLATALSGPNVTITNASITGIPIQYGQFTYTGVGFPMDEGVVLSTGSIFDMPGPNSSSGTSTGTGGAGNALLTSITGQQTYDAVVLQFDFQVQSDNIEFEYIFASEEYNEFVGSINDAFGFFISGPGIVGEENIALVPTTTVPVSINNINMGSYWQFYNNNETGNTNIEYDGYTTVMTAQKTGLIPCQTYTLKLIIADAADPILDSGVFLRANSLIQQNVSVQSNTASTNGIALEGCVQASFTFNLDAAYPINTSIPFQVGGTAIEGVDYQNLDASLIIPAGQTSGTIFINAIADGLTEGQESIDLIYQNSTCGTYDTITLYIDDYVPLEFTSTPGPPSCTGDTDGEILFGVTGGTAPYNYMITDSATNVTTTYTTNPVTGLGAGTYFIEVTDVYGCAADDVVSGNLFSGGPVFLPDGNGNAYTNTLVLTGFGGQTLTSISQLQSICLNIEHSRLHEVEIFLTAPDGTTITLKQQPGGGFTNLGEPEALGPSDVGNTDVTPGIGYDYCFTTTPTYGTMVDEAGNYNYTYTTVLGNVQTDSYLPTGSYQSFDPLTDLIGVPLDGNWTLTIEDHVTWNNGYLFSWSISLMADSPDSIAVIPDPVAPTISHTLVQPSCGNNNGSINVTVTGGTGPFTYSWSSGPTTQDLNSIGAGNYTLTVTDGNGCDHLYTVSLSNSTGVSLSAVIGNQTCVGLNTGSINITPSGGTLPYNFLWSNSAVTEDISGLAPGNYTVQVTDGASCITTGNYTVLAASPIIITGAVTNEFCSDQEGEIDITVIGGQAGYTYLWGSGATSEDVTDLGQGTHTVTVTDANLCTQVENFTVINVVGSCTPVCDLAITSQLITDETCGQGNGSINLSVFTSNSPLVINWSNGFTSEDISSLDAGNYSVTLSDAEGCSLIQTYSVVNNTGTLAISGSSITNELCGNSQGGVNVTVSGGAMPYSFSWSNGATTEDISGVAAGNFLLTITDANGCQLTQNFAVVNNSGTLVQTWGNVVDIVCDEPVGSIDISVSGGVPPYIYLWSNSATTQDLINLGAGTFSCQITDQAGCIINTPVYTVQNTPGTLFVSNINSDNEVCGNSQGEILLTVSGGTIPYSYLWSNGPTSQNITGLSAGTYSCTITDNNGCALSTGPVNIINESGSLQLLSIASFDEVCSNGDGSINLEVTGGTSPYQILWNTMSTSEDLVSLSAGSYNCVVTDASGCEISANATISNNSGTLSIDNAVVTNENCGDGTGAINLIISGGSPAYNYLWSNAATTEDLVGLNAGTYSVTVTDISGCEASASVSVANNSGAFSATLNSIVNESCGASDGSIDISVSGGSVPYSYLWSNSATSEDLTLLAAGTYSCTVTDNVGCIVNVGPFVVNNSSGSLSVSSVVITDEDCNLNNGAINISVAGGAPAYNYLWSTTATSEDITGLNSGTYSVTITDQNGCEVTQNYVVNNDPGTLAISSVLISDEVCNNNLGAIDISVTGGSGSYTYSWNSGPTSQDISNLSSGSYSVTVTDGVGCSVNSGSLALVNNPGNFTLVSMNVIDETCGDGGGSINVTTTGGSVPVNYAWNSGPTTQDISSLSSGTYSAIATDASGCVLNYSVVVNNDPGSLATSAPVITAATCVGSNGAIDISVSGGTPLYNYVWSNGSVTEDITNLAPGNYTVNISDVSGCSITETYVVGDNGGSPVINSTLITDDVCSSSTGEISVGVSGGTTPYTYLWSISNPCCTYMLEMTDWNFDNWGTAAVNVYINSALYGTYTGTGWSTIVSIPVCTGDQIQLEYIANGTSDWENGYVLTNNGNVVYQDGNPPTAGISYTGIAACNGPTGQGTNTLTGLSAGTYNVLITDANGCSVTADIAVQNTGGSTYVSNSVVTDDNCGDGIGSIDLTVISPNPPVQYSWSNGPTTQDQSSLNAGTYIVTISDASGCQFDETYTINNLTSGFTIDNVVITDTYCGDMTGAIDITINGGVPGYTYSWSNGPIVEDISGVIAGTYTVTVTDNSGCELQQTYVVNNTTNGLTATNIVVDELCGQQNGSIDLTISGGVSPYSILWSTTDVTEDLFGLDAGTYDYTITDGAGCETSGSVVVADDNGNLMISAFNVTDDICSQSQGMIDITITGGSGTPTFLWSNSDVNEDLFWIAAGTYSVTVTDGLGCTASQSFTVGNTNTYSIVTPANITNSSCSTCADGAIDITIDWGGNPPGTLYFMWSNGEWTEDISALVPGDYIVEIWDDFGCYVTDTFTVSNGLNLNHDELEMIQVYPNPSNGIVTVQFDESAVGALIKIVDVQGRELTYTLLPGSNNSVVLNLSHLASGTYFVHVYNNDQVTVKPIVITARF